MTVSRAVRQRRLQVSPAVHLELLESGMAGREALVFLHGFPEAAFVWEPLLAHFGSRFHAIAPNLRGYAGSSSPPSVEAYRTRHIVADLVALIEQTGRPLEALVAHDWGGAAAWTLAATRPELLKRLVIVNSPHPATFLHALQTDEAQQRASDYMNFLARPDAPALLAENDHARLWPFLTGMAPAGGVAGAPAWLDDAMRDRYRGVWRQGLAGPCHYYGASPLRPPAAGQTSGGVFDVRLPPELATVRVPTRVVWADRDIALLPVLLDGLDRWVQPLEVVHVPDATHWIVHEQPQRVIAEVEAALSR